MRFFVLTYGATNPRVHLQVITPDLLYKGEEHIGPVSYDCRDKAADGVGYDCF
jgi:hypothetical protein